MRALFFLLTIAFAAGPIQASDSVAPLDYDTLKPFLVNGENRYFGARYATTAEQDDLDSFVALRQAVEGPEFALGPSDAEVLVALTDGSADVQISYVFVPKENFTIEDYLLTPQIGNLNIIDDNDVSINTVETSLNGQLAYNVTVDIDFNKWTGISDFSILAQNQTTSAVETTSANAELTVVGITFFQVDAGGEIQLIGGPNFPLNVQTSNIVVNNDVNLGVFIQYFDGSTSNTSIQVPLTGVGITTSGLDAQINYSASCSPTVGTFDGSDVALPATCGMGFSTNEVNNEYVGPQYGFDFNLFENGSFVSSFEYNELVEGSDLELEGYSTFIEVNVLGEVPPLVTAIFPEGPFGSLGTEIVTLNIENLPTSVEDRCSKKTSCH